MNSKIQLFLIRIALVKITYRFDDIRKRGVCDEEPESDPDLPLCTSSEHQGPNSIPVYPQDCFCHHIKINGTGGLTNGKYDTFHNGKPWCYIISEASNCTDKQD